MRARDTDSTRYLCAAAHLDDHFARQVLDEVLHQPHRAVAPSYGIDLGPILRHCLEARRRLLVRDVLVTIALVAVLVLAVADGGTVVLGILILWLAAQGTRLLAERAVNAGLILVGVALLLGFVLVRVVPQVGSFGYDEYPSEHEGGLTTVVWLLALVAIWGAYFWHRAGIHRLITTELRADSFDGARAPAADPAYESRLAYVEQAQRGNVTVYSKDWALRPFVGSGQVMTEWHLVTPLRPAETGLEALTSEREGGPPRDSGSFDANTLYERTREGLVALAHPSLAPHERVHQLSVQDRVFIAGLLPTASPFVDAHWRPIFRMSADAVQAVDRNERGPVRHYQTVRMAAWQGELEVTAFLYVAVRGGLLYVEFVATKLPGIRPEYHKIDDYEHFGTGAAVATGLRALMDLAGCPLATLNVGTRALEAIRRALDPAADTREIHRRLAFDYGARSSVREIGAHFSKVGRFQDYDAEERVSLVERRLLEIVVDTMREHGYDVGDLVGQATTVINNSTLVGSVSGTGIAVGAGARSDVRVHRRTAASAAPAAWRRAKGTP